VRLNHQRAAALWWFFGLFKFCYNASMQCLVCDDPEYRTKWAKWEIKKFPLWTIYIHPNQCYLGRCFVVLNRHKDDFFDIEKEELEEYFFVVKKLRDVAAELFQPDLFNYAILQNNLNHVHLNFVPRYKGPRTVEDTEFTDERWGHNYSPYNKDYQISDELLIEIKDKIKSKFT
jgi:diadenosine tetraphosphate (Ap4A) HIT family hydrolase